MLDSADIIIIGGGIAGCALLYELSKASLGKVILLERATIASATTSESGGFIRQFNTDQTLRHLTRESYQYYRNFQQETNKSCGFINTGMVYRFPAPLTLDLQTHIQQLNTHDYRVTTLNSNDHVIVHEHAAGYIDTAQTCRAWVQAARNYQGEAYEHVAVEKILIEDKKVYGVQTITGIIHAPRVMMATGAWTNLYPTYTPVNAKSFQYNVYQSAAHHLGCAYLDAVNQFYLFPLRNGDAVAGLLQDGKPVMDGKFNHLVNDDESNNLHTLVQNAFPQIQKTSLSLINLSYDSFTEDSYLAAPHSSIRGLFILSGLSAGGIKIAPALAKKMVQAL